jgi:acyl-CoA thioester hydrolase
MDLSSYYYQVKIEKRWSDLDEFHMVNNAVIMTYLEEARVRFFQEKVQWNWQKVGVVVANANINYKLPITFSDNPTVYMKCIKIGTKSFVIEYVLAEQKGEETKIYVDGTTAMVCFDVKTFSSVPIPDEIRTQFEALHNQ